MKCVLAPSILSADFKNLGQEIKKTEDNGAEFLHFDVMDGLFVPSISFGVPVLKSIRSVTDQIIDAHLMIQDPIRYIETFKEAGADYVTVHLEACENVEKTLAKIHECGMKAGLSICPETAVETIIPYVEMVDLILIMGVHPGFGGQKLIPETFDRLRQVRQILDEKNPKVDVQVDGGIHLGNVREILDAGANIIVTGSAVFNGDVEENTRKFMEILRDYE